METERVVLTMKGLAGNGCTRDQAIKALAAVFGAGTAEWKGRQATPGEAQQAEIKKVGDSIRRDMAKLQEPGPLQRWLDRLATDPRVDQRTRDIAAGRLTVPKTLAEWKLQRDRA